MTDYVTKVEFLMYNICIKNKYKKYTYTKKPIYFSVCTVPSIISNGAVTTTKPLVGVDEHFNIVCDPGYAVVRFPTMSTVTVYCLQNGRFADRPRGSSLPDLNCVIGELYSI